MARMKYSHLLLADEDMSDADIRAAAADAILGALSLSTGLDVTMEYVTLRRSEGQGEWLTIEERWPEGTWAWRATVIVDDGVLVAA